MALRMILAFLLLSGTWRQAKPPDSQATGTVSPYVEKAEKEFNFYPGGKLEIRLAAPGNLQILGWNRAAVRAEMEKIVYYLPPSRQKRSCKVTRQGLHGPRPPRRSAPPG